ncbi:MAG: hypothetical protein ABJA86_07905 [Nocardioidaceae bacterium]
METDERFCINQSVALVRPDRTEVNPVYAVGYLSSERVQSILKGMGKGNALAHLQITELARMTVPKPPLATQDVYACRVSEIASARRVMRRQADMLDSAFASLHQRAFAGAL